MNLTTAFLSTFFITIVISSYPESENNVLKSVYGTQNDTIVSIKTYDQKGRLIFDRTTQIIEDWNNGLLTWMTAKEYQDDRLIFEYYAHSNLVLRIKVYDYDPNGVFRDTYVKFHSASSIEGRNPFADIYQIETFDSLKSFLLHIIPDSTPFAKHIDYTPEHVNYFRSSIDSTGLNVNEYWTIEGGSNTKTKVEKYDTNDRLVYSYHKDRWNEGVTHFKYDSLGHRIEELEIYDIRDHSFQKKEHVYIDGLLHKTFFYHDTSLAFTFEYIYQDTLLIREVHTRITEAEHFKNRSKSKSIDYKYIYF
jgi:hypothetical protein